MHILCTYIIIYIYIYIYNVHAYIYLKILYRYTYMSVYMNTDIRKKRLQHVFSKEKNK